MNVWTKTLGAAGVVGGVIGAAALGGMTAQRVAVRRYRNAEVIPDEGYDAIAPDRTYSVAAADGAVLYVEEAGPLDAPLTVVLAHGWALRMGSWHYQRLALAGPGFGPVSTSGRLTKGAPIRMVFYDQRSHGRSSRGPNPHPTIGTLAQDLAAVIATAVPSGPVVLIGHSMGGMAVLGLAGADPGFFAQRVAGVGLLSTSASQVPTAEIGKIFLRGSNPVVKAVSTVATRYSKVIERSRPAAKDAVWLATRVLGFARRDIPASLVDYLDQMLSDTPIEVIADFVPGVLAHDQTAALPALAGIPVLILCGDTDRMTPASQSRFIAAALPEAEFVLVERAGHLPMMEAPEETNDALRRLLRRSASYAAERLQLASDAVPTSA